MKALILLLALVSTSTTSWAFDTQDLKLNTGLRYRHEFVDQEAGNKKYHQHKIKASVKATAKVNDSSTLVLQLTTGNYSPVSTNQTLGAMSGNKPIELDQAYFTWAASKSLTLTGGKMKNPLYQVGSTGFLLDGDWTPEGLNLGWTCSCDKGSWFANISTFWLGANASGGGTDSGVIAEQVGKMFKIGEHKLTVGLTGYLFTLQGQNALGGALKGNTDGGGATYAKDYEIYELFSQYEMGQFKFFLDYATNTRFSTQNNAYLVGVNYKNVKEKGDYAVGYTYRETEADAIVGALNDGDFNGGSTDTNGHKLSVKYGLEKNTTATISLYANNTGIQNSTNYTKAHFDFVFKF